MQKNEAETLDLWIKYHSRLLGPKSLFILDNGSTDERTLKILSGAKASGVFVDDRFKTKDDFSAKGKRILEVIRTQQALNAFDFYFPLDADELLACEVAGQPKFTKNALSSVLKEHVGEKKVLRIGAAYNNNPLKEDTFRRTEDYRKCFFYKNTAKKLDLGFHEAETEAGHAFIKTNVVYFHFHYKSYEKTVQRSREKLTGRVSSFSKEDLTQFLKNKGAGFHLVNDLLMSRDEFYAPFRNTKSAIQIPGVIQHLKKIGAYDDLLELMSIEPAKLNQSPLIETPPMALAPPVMRRPTLSIPEAEAQHLTSTYTAANTILEYGSGGSTALAAEMPGKTVFSVESDRDWVAMMQRWFQQEPPKGKVHLHHVDIGPTKEWGYPKDESRRLHWIDYPMSVWERPDLIHPDVVLIDGRFRVGCFLATLMNIRRPTTILFDDYGDRPHYHIVEELLKPTQHVGRMAVFDARPRALHPSELRRFGSYFFRPE